MNLENWSSSQVAYYKIELILHEQIMMLYEGKQFRSILILRNYYNSIQYTKVFLQNYIKA